MASVSGIKFTGLYAGGPNKKPAASKDEPYPAIKLNNVRNQGELLLAHATVEHLVIDLPQRFSQDRWEQLKHVGIREVSLDPKFNRLTVTFEPSASLEDMGDLPEEYLGFDVVSRIADDSGVILAPANKLCHFV